MSSGFMFFSLAQSLKLLSAQLVLLSVFLGVKPFEGVESSALDACLKRLLGGGGLLSSWSLQ